MSLSPAYLALSLSSNALMPSAHLAPGRLATPSAQARFASLHMEDNSPLTYAEYLAQKNGQQLSTADMQGKVEPTQGGETRDPAPEVGSGAFGALADKFSQLTSGDNKDEYVAESNGRSAVDLVSEKFAGVGDTMKGIQMPSLPNPFAQQQAAQAGDDESEDAYAMELFSKYDGDRSGYIDIMEFKSLAREIKTDRDRRTVLQLASAVVGSLVVAEYSSEYQAAQKVFRPVFVEGEAEASQAKIFPTAQLSTDIDSAVARVLAKRGFTPTNTLFSHSVCSDEVNGKDQQLMPLMVERWGEGFALGGLAGLPFAGKSGFRAYLHHVPDNGKLLIMFAPHVGVDGQGRIGALQREGQDAVSKACGAAIGAFKALGKARESGAGAGGPVLNINDNAYEDFDPQIQQIIKLLAPKLDGIEESANDVGFVTYQMYGIVRDLVDACITQTPDVWDWTNEVALVGGIIINRKNGGDFFQPLTFETRTKGAQPVDLFEDAFGKRPDLSPILGSQKVASQIYGEETLSAISKSLRSSLPAL